MQSSQAALVADLAERYGPMIYATAYRILGNREEASDAYQEVFLKLMKSGAGGQGRPVEEWGAYLRVAAAHCAVTLLRRRPRWQVADSEVIEAAVGPAGEDPRAQAIARWYDAWPV